MNLVGITGRIVSEVVRRRVDGHGVVAEFRVAVDGRNPIFLTVETWGHSAGKAATYLTPGRRVAITGRCAQREYLTREGQRRHVDYIVAHDITYLDSPTSAREVGEAAPGGLTVEAGRGPVDAGPAR